MELAHKKYGQLPWKKLFEPSIELARKGFTVGRALAKAINASSQFILKDKAFRDIFAPSGNLLREGDVARRERFADTLELIARDGADAFYEGPIAETMVEDIRQAGGIITLKDWSSYRAMSRQTLVGSYRGLRLVTAPSPACGSILLMALNLLENFDMNSGNNASLNVHRMLESLKFGFAYRTYLGDPEFLKVYLFKPDILPHD